MSGIVIVIAVGVFVASLIAFAINVMVPSDQASSTEDRLAQMAARRRGVTGDEPEKGSLLLAGGLDDKASVLNLSLIHISEPTRPY